MAEVIPKPTLLYGTFTIATAGTTQVIPITGMTSSGVVSVIYCHTGASGAGQYLKSITPTTNQISTLWGSSCAVGESIVWNVLSFY
jgi:hypothetical protein